MSEAFKIEDIFAENVFTVAKMKERLPKKVFANLKNVMDNGGQLAIEDADVIAKAMKDWAQEKGATHYTHWFQPLITSLTAEKHDSFVTHPDEDGKVISSFTGKQLIMGEPDASSFPSGGLRATCAARGYTVWDVTSPAFIREGAIGAVLCIPTVFCSYTGETLDKKAPLLRSMEAVSKEAMRIVKLFDPETEATKVTASVGPEQEYFLISKDSFDARKDLKFTGRTLFGAPAPKGQELEDQYFGAIKENVGSFMKDLNRELWKLGITATTQHNEVAPGQHEMAPIYMAANIAVDNNLLAMETLNKVAERHGLECLLHEKPFAGVNGSGKHNNWSLSTNTGINLLDPGKTPNKNRQFLLVLACIMKAVDRHSDLLRQSASDVGNDHRLGANEAPPAIISIYLGDQLEDVVNQIIEKGSAESCIKGEELNLGISTVPVVTKDATDRNRTSPFAFTGNKFEFRMCPSSGSISGPNFVLNAIVAEVLSEFADRLEKAHDVEAEVNDIIIETVKKHKRIIFNGNGYSEDWIEEAARRGLPNITTTEESIKSLLDEKNIEVLEKHNVLTREEVHSRYEISLENYSKTINIEALTMIEMTKREILPAVISFAGKLAKGINEMKSTGLSLRLNCQDELLEKVCILTNSADEKVKVLENVLLKAEGIEESYEQAYAYKFEVVAAMDDLREDIDALETIVGKEYWPLPTYTDLLFSV